MEPKYNTELLKGGVWTYIETGEQLQEVLCSFHHNPIAYPYIGAYVFLVGDTVINTMSTLGIRKNPFYKYEELIMSNNQYDLTKPGAVRSLEPVMVEVRDNDCHEWKLGELLAVRPDRDYKYTTLGRAGDVYSYRQCRHLKWTPKEGELFYHIDEMMDTVEEEYNSNSCLDIALIKCNNYYQTVEQAEQARGKIQAIHNEER